MIKLAVIAGPTGSGKTELATRLALAHGGEIVNYDSVQIYRGFDIGSAKPTVEQRMAVPHHLFDIVDAGEEFNAADFARLARSTCEEIASRGTLPILAGGTFFYLRALLGGLPELPGRDPLIRGRIKAIATRKGGPERLHRWLARVDPISAARTPTADRHRLERALEVWMTSGQPISTRERPGTEVSGDLRVCLIGLEIERSLLRTRLDARVEAMYRDGLIEETRALLERFSPEARPFQAIGYREAVEVVAGRMELTAAVVETQRRTRSYAKRQMTWLRSDRNVQWLDAPDRDSTFAAATRLIERLHRE